MSKLNWIYVTTAMVLLLVGTTITLYLQRDRFELDIVGNSRMRYREGVLTVYDGRFVAFSSEITPYYYNTDRRAYIVMYKARGEKYSDLRYTDGCLQQPVMSCSIEQDIKYSRGVLTRVFEIRQKMGIVEDVFDKTYELKESFYWVPNDPTLRVYFRWNYDRMDSLDNAIVYVGGGFRQTFAEVDKGYVIDWEPEINNIVRAERFKNGKLTIRTRVYVGSAYFDPTILIPSAGQYGGSATSVNATNQGNLYWHIEVNTGGSS
jgi:hypothetical protein